MSDKAMVHSGLSASIPVEGGAGRFAELIARLEAVEVGSMELDAAICITLGYVGNNQGYSPLNVRISDGDDEWLDYELGPVPYTAPIPDVSQSLDAALALAERVLPGCRCIAERDHDGSGWACVRVSEGADRFMADAKTTALALCISILKALEAKQ